MKLNKILKNTLLVVLACFALSACATKKVSTGQLQSDVYTGKDTVEYLDKMDSIRNTDWRTTFPELARHE